jgi:hypothetical protein
MLDSQRQVRTSVGRRVNFGVRLATRIGGPSRRRLIRLQDHEADNDFTMSTMEFKGYLE